MDSIVQFYRNLFNTKIFPPSLEINQRIKFFMCFRLVNVGASQDTIPSAVPNPVVSDSTVKIAWKSVKNVHKDATQRLENVSAPALQEAGVLIVTNVSSIAFPRLEFA